MRYIEFADRLIESQIRDEMSDKHRPRLTLRHLRALRRMRATRVRRREVELELVRKMYGNSDEDIDAKATVQDKLASGLGKVALQSVKAEDKYEQGLGREALDRVRKKC